MKKRLLAMFLALMMCLVLLTTAVLAASSDFTIENGVLTKYNGPGGDVVIPGSVTSIGYGAFDGCTGLTSITIPDSITSIGGSAFYGCTGLTSVTIPDNVIEIGVWAFSRCTGLTSVTIPNSVTDIGYNMFSGCTGLTSVTIPDGVTNIEGDAFYGCTGLTSVTIPNSVTSIGSGAFYGCMGLTSATIPNSVTSIAMSAFSDCMSLVSVTIPSSVTKIGNSAFYNCMSLTDVYYSGNENNWGKIKFGDGNDFLRNSTIHYNSPMPEQPTTPTTPTTPDKPTVPATAPAEPTNDRLTVNGVEATPAAYKINGANYFKLRDVAALLNGTDAQFSVDWDPTANVATITSGQPYEKLDSDLQGKPTASDTATTSSDVIYINGVKAELTIYKIGTSNYFSLRELGKALDFNVGWAEGKGMYIESDKPYTDAD